VSEPDAHPGPAERLIERRVRRRGLRPRDAAALIVAVWLSAVVIFGVLEHLLDPDTFPTVWLGMWWALETVTTVGYGDVVPASTEGKAVASLLLLGGLALLSVVTATITSAFIARREQASRRDVDVELLEELRALRREVRELSGREPDAS
jgi:voltage-gated potassium channel